jgi:hypothetical protein
MAQVLTLDGVTIEQPKEFTIEKYYLSKAGRTADGLMHIDKIASKRKFLFSYEALRGDYLDDILDILEGDDVFFTLTYKENDVEKSATVYTGAISQKQFRTDGYWVWVDVSFDLIEQ